MIKSVDPYIRIIREGDFFTVMSDRHTAALILALYEVDVPLMMESL